MPFEDLAARLKGELFLSSMMGWTDGAFCAARAQGCAMVQLGAFVLRDDQVERDTYTVAKEPAALAAHMKKEFDRFRAGAAKSVGKDQVPVVSANVFPCTDEHVAVSVAAFFAAGGEVYELNAHGGIGQDRRRGTGRMLFMPEHRPKLMRWAKMLVESGGPIIVKGRGGVIPDFTDHVREFEQLGVFAFHVNVRSEEEGRPDLGLVERIRAATGMVLLASGYVNDAAGARAMFDAGADCVGIAEAAVQDPRIFLKCRP